MNSVNSGNLTVVTKSGTTYTPPVNPGGTPQQTKQGPDRNGNQITFDPATGKFTDTLGQVVLTASGTNPVTYSYTAPSGAPAPVSVQYTSYTVKTAFGITNVAEYGPASNSLVSKIVLPDGTSYSFTYEATPASAACTPASGTYSANCITGRIGSVALPAGGSISYAYSGGPNGTGIEPDGSTAGLSRAVSPGGTWQYARASVSGSTPHWTTTVTSPPDPANAGSASNVSVIDFQEDIASTSNNFYETKRQVYQGSAVSAHLLETILKCYNGSPLTGCDTTAVRSPITQIDVLPQYPSGRQSRNETKYDVYGNVTDTYQYDFGTSAPGTLLRHTATTYALGLGNNIFDQPLLIVVTDGASSPNTLSSTSISYDESAYPVKATTGTQQHVSITGARGNATTVTNITAGTATVTGHFQYYDTGTLYKAWDVNAGSTQFTLYTYGTTAQGSTTVSCGNSFPTQVTSPPTPNVTAGLTKGYAWDCIGGVATSTTDANGNSMTTSYSNTMYWRPDSLKDPLTNTTAFTYTPAGSSTPASVESQTLFNGGNSISEQLTTLDGLGQTVISQQQEGVSSTNYDSAQAIHDALGRLSQSTMPYVGSAGQGSTTAKVTTRTYDALGRVTKVQDGGGGYVSYTYNQNDVLQASGPAPTGENLKQRQVERDALGRITSVCEITASTGSGACSQVNAVTGYLTTYAYDTTTINSVPYTRVTVTQNAQAAAASRQTRTFIYDLLGRLIQETNPETGNGAPGTTKYTYDSDSAGTCSGTYKGDLVKIVDNRGNITCYSYDILHRIQSITYATGSPDLGNTQAKNFVYDAATLNATAMSNATGLLAEAYTGTSSAKVTDEFFSYSKRGELTDVYESTPHSGTPYYHVTAGYWANGAVNTLSSNIAAVPTQTYGVDGMGRPATVTASSSSNPNLITGTAYDLANFQTTLTFGTGDTDVFSSDPNTGRLAKYQFNLNGKSDMGTLTWNANGSLGKLAIADTIAGTGDTQTCNYTHDDLSRIASANCGAAWNQTFSYDAFGNITKNATVGITFTPGYSSTTNQFTSLTGATPTYDADGRLTYDGTNHYTWDADSSLRTVDTTPNTTTETYDAMGRMVEKAVGTTYTQFVFSPLGGKYAVMNGQTLSKGFVPLPTGANAVYSSNGLAYYRHHDHLGNSRLATTPGRALYAETAYAPFGEPYTENNGTNGTDRSFTGKDEDTVSGMYDFPARRYRPSQSRWLSPDPAGVSAVAFDRPQTWNRYAYVENNPLSYVDPDGTSDDFDFNFGSSHSGAGSLGDYFVASLENGIFAGVYGWGGTSCTIDGTPSSCDMTFGLIRSGIGAQCPLGNCGLVRQDPENGLWQVVNGYQERTLLDGPDVLVPVWEDYSPDFDLSFGAQAANNGPSLVPHNPCAQAGHAPDTSVYETKGQAASTNAIKDWYNLSQFPAGGGLDAQPQGASPAYANYVYGVYMSAAGYTLQQALSGADLYAEKRGRYPASVPMARPDYPFTPVANVKNITNGFNAQQAGTLCHK